MTRANVVLLRSPSEDTPDPYESAFKAQDYNALSIPALGASLVNVEDLKLAICEGPGKKGLSGVIVTSARACQAWRKAVEELVESRSNEAAGDWSCTPFYVVGEATARRLHDIRAAYPTSSYAPQDVRGANQTGTGEALARFILKDLPPPTTGQRLFYLTGDKNRDTLPNLLHEGGVELENLQVYGTTGSETFEKDLEDGLAKLKSTSSGTDRWWIVYFAPSAAEFATPFLRKHFHLPSSGSAPSSSSPSPNIAAIGPTTSTSLRGSLQLHVDAVAKKPNPESLVGAIADHDQNNDSN